MLVMFFVLHILVLTIPLRKVTSAPLRANTSDIANYSKGKYVEIPSFKSNVGFDGLSQNASAFRTQKPMFQILRNLTKPRSNNLKSNIFDKMLSEEMLSIKQRFFERDLVHSSTANKAKQNPAPTPTVEVHQKWSVVDLFTNSAIDEVVTKSAEDKNDILIDSENSVAKYLLPDDLKHSNTSISKNKILELRSLPSVRHAETAQYQAQGSSCPNVYVTSKCCTRPDQQRCIQCTQCTHTVADTSVSYSVYPLYLQPYQSFIFSDNLENPYENMYYHPKVVDDLKIPRKTRRRKTRPLPVDVYYDDSDNKDIVDDEYPLRPRTKPPNIIMNINYDLVDDKPKKSTFKKDDGNRFNLMNDLNDVFNDGVNKKCYCSKSTLTLSKQWNILLIFVIVHTF